MAKVSKRFVHSYLNNKILESIKPLNEIKDALEPVEQELIAEIESIITKIICIEL